MQRGCNGTTYNGISSHGDTKYKQNIEDTKKSTDVKEDLSLTNASYFSINKRHSGTSLKVPDQNTLETNLIQR